MNNKFGKIIKTKSPDYIVRLSKLVEVQDVETVVLWCISYSEMNLLPIIKEHFIEETSVERAISMVKLCLSGENSLSKTKKCLLHEQQRLSNYSTNPTIEIAAKAILFSLSSVYNSSAALSLAFIGTTAILYKKYGSNKSQNFYNLFAPTIWFDMEKELLKLSFKNGKSQLITKSY